MIRRLLAFSLLALMAPAAAAGAIEFPVTNGRDVVAWVDGHTLRISYDDGTARAFPVPGPDCRLGGVNSTAAGFLCGTPDVPETLDLVDLQSGQVSHPATEARIEANTGPTAGRAAYDLEALGDHVARIGWGDFHTEGTDWFSLDAGGGLLDLSRPPAGSVVDLDAPGGIAPVCEPKPTRALTPLRYRAPWILTQHGARVQLRHCGSTVTRTIGSSPWKRPVLTARFAAWKSDASHVTIRVLASGRTYRVPAPHLESLLATDHRLVVQASYARRYRVTILRVR